MLWGKWSYMAGVEKMVTIEQISVESNVDKFSDFYALN